jgi:tartrate-resistant acid phosphatase type 5
MRERLLRVRVVPVSDRRAALSVLLAAAFACALPALSCSDDAKCTEAKALGGSEPSGQIAQPLSVSSVKLLVIGDIGEGNLEQTLVARAMAHKCAAVGGCDAVLLVGDNFYDAGVHDVGDPQFATKFEQPYDFPSLDIPFYAVLGNHDVEGDWQAQIDYAALPVGASTNMRSTARWNMPASYYDVRLRNVHIFGFDTNELGDPTEAQDMAARVASSDATFKIAFAHHPRFTSGSHRYDNEPLGAAGMFALERSVYCNTRLYISGHDHDSELIERGRDAECPHTWFAISGAGSQVRHSPAPRDPSSLYFDDETPAFAYIEATEDRLHLEFVDMCENTRYSRDLD